MPRGGEPARDLGVETFDEVPRVPRVRRVIAHAEQRVLGSGRTARPCGSIHSEFRAFSCVRRCAAASIPGHDSVVRRVPDRRAAGDAGRARASRASAAAAVALSPFVRGLLAGIVAGLRRPRAHQQHRDRGSAGRAADSDRHGRAGRRHRRARAPGSSGRASPTCNAMRRVLLGVRLWRAASCRRCCSSPAAAAEGTDCPVAEVMSGVRGRAGRAADARGSPRRRSRSTHENAEFSAPLLRQRGVQADPGRHRSAAHAPGRRGVRARRASRSSAPSVPVYAVAPRQRVDADLRLPRVRRAPVLSPARLAGRRRRKARSRRAGRAATRRPIPVMLSQLPRAVERPGRDPRRVLCRRLEAGAAGRAPGGQRRRRRRRVVADAGPLRSRRRRASSARGDPVGLHQRHPSRAEGSRRPGGDQGPRVSS